MQNEFKATIQSNRFDPLSLRYLKEFCMQNEGSEAVITLTPMNDLLKSKEELAHQAMYGFYWGCQIKTFAARLGVSPEHLHNKVIGPRFLCFVDSENQYRKLSTRSLYSKQMSRLMFNVDHIAWEEYGLILPRKEQIKGAKYEK